MNIRWGILGAGDIVRKRVARAISDQPSCQLVAAWRRDQARLADFCRDFDVPRACTTEAELLDDPDIDAVYIATPVSLHLPEALAAARTGKHVLVEKPMARSVAECDQMIAACSAQGVKLGVAYYRRFYPVVNRMKELLASGAIGQALSVSAVTTTPFAIAPGEEGYWRVHASEGGGALMDIGSHRLNLFLDLLGPIAEVKALCGTLAGSHASEDCASVILRFASGVHGSLQCFFSTRVPVDTFAILGTTGRLSTPNLNDGTLIVEGASQSVEHHPPAGNLHAPLIDDFAAAIRENRPPLVTGEEGRQANEVMERAYRDSAMSRNP